MKIRTRILFVLIPSILGSCLLIAGLFMHNWPHAFLFSIGWGLLLSAIVPLFISRKIAHPVQKLNNSALAIAAGHYGDRIRIKGPKEIEELSNTLNTMSECMHETINRLKENSLLRERLFGEYECAMLLQDMMLQKMIDSCSSEAIAVKAITFFSDTPRGLLLDLPMETNGLLPIHLVEARKAGFEGMVELLTQYKLNKEQQKSGYAKKFSSLQVLYDREKSLLSYKAIRFPLPLIWSVRQATLTSPSAKEVPIQSGDYFFLCNGGLAQLWNDSARLQELISKVLRFFAEEGLESCAGMLRKEIGFFTKRKQLQDDAHLLCFHILD